MAYSSRHGGTWWCCIVIFCLYFTVVVAQTGSGSASIAIDPTGLPNTATPEPLTPGTLTPQPLTPETLTPETPTPETTSPATTAPATSSPTPTSLTPTSPTPTTNTPTITPSPPAATITRTPGFNSTSAPDPATSSSASGSASDTNNSSKSSSSLGLAAIVGIAVGCVVLMTVLIVFFIVQRRRHKNRASETDDIFELPIGSTKVLLLDPKESIAVVTLHSVDLSIGVTSIHLVQRSFPLRTAFGLEARLLGNKDVRSSWFLHERDICLSNVLVGYIPSKCKACIHHVQSKTLSEQPICCNQARNSTYDYSRRQHERLLFFV
ncbi:hypothetical protein PC129_g18015 [Phytophthora cactorum]|uniref:Uncharacterized protein n=1 Tax=Phytophthora cactorum TaxID=29920 RepID=A0A8T1HEW5_9STRA|nr:hypothetical protein PC129_g18015 [Phytophthora cactorum]